MVVSGINSEPKHMSRFEEPCGHRAGILGQCPSSGRIQCVSGALAVGLPVACRLEAAPPDVSAAARLLTAFLSFPAGVPRKGPHSQFRPWEDISAGAPVLPGPCSSWRALLVCTLVWGSASTGRLWTRAWPSPGALGLPIPA